MNTRKTLTSYIIICLIIFAVSFVINLISFQMVGIERGCVCFEKETDVTRDNYKGIVEKLYAAGAIDSARYQEDIILPDDSAFAETQMRTIGTILQMYEKDSIIREVCKSGRFNYLYDDIIRNPEGVSDLTVNISDPNDTIAVIREGLFNMYNLDFLKFVSRVKILKEELLPLGYSMSMSVTFSFFGPTWSGDFSYFKMFIAWLYGWYFNGATWNPLMFICLPVGICFLIFSRKARRQFKLFIGKICRRIRSRVDR